MDILAMIRISISTVATAVLNPDANYGFILFIFILYLQYKKNLRFQEIIYGQPKTPISSLILSSVLAGLVVGILISIPMTIAGITFSQHMGTGAMFLIVISLVLMLVEPRFICFSYSGGLLSIVGLIFSIDMIDVTGIMMLVAILHLVESVLMFFDGHRGALPVFLEGEDGTVTGGFSMQRFWPLPIAIVLFVGFGGNEGGVATPDWWPLVGPYIDQARIKDALYTAFPLAAIIGYGDFTSSMLPKEKCRESAYKLAVFSLILLFLSIVSSYVYVFKYIAAIFAPVAHDILIKYQKDIEKKRPRIFAPADDGIKVLDTLPGGAGETMGIQPGDTVMSINNKTVRNEEALNKFFEEYIAYIWVDVKDISGNVKTLEYKDYREGIDGLDIITVSKGIEALVTVREQRSYLKRLIGRLNNKGDK